MRWKGKKHLTNVNKTQNHCLTMKFRPPRHGHQPIGIGQASGVLITEGVKRPLLRNSGGTVHTMTTIIGKVKQNYHLCKRGRHKPIVERKTPVRRLSQAMKGRGET